MEKKKHISNEEEDDEQKVEQFFALIRSFQEAKNKRENELRQMEELKKKKKKKKQRKLDVDDEAFKSWVPAFEWADFTEEIEFRRPPIIFPNPYSKKEGKKIQEEDDDVDLKLTL